jgi:dienelactone hydrolase
MIRDRDEFEVEIPAGRVSLTGQLCIPDQPIGIVVFAHGPGSERHSPRNQEIARALVAQGFATLLFDLLTADEDGDRHARFDVHLLANRLVNVLEWIAHQPHLEAMPIGLFGANTGAASALIAATRMRSVAAVVSRAGRPDLAHEALPQVSAPLLLIVGAHDHEVLELNRRALRQINAPAKLHIVEGASHEFDEPGTLGEVMVAATAWFRKHLCAPTMHEQFGSAWES